MLAKINSEHVSSYIRTSYSDSALTLYCNDSLIPFQGVLQDNGISHAIWVIISIPLLNMLRTTGNGAKSKTPISKQSNLVVAFVFVDDTI